jgi:hypothetical protein
LNVKTLLDFALEPFIGREWQSAVAMKNMNLGKSHATMVTLKTNNIEIDRESRKLLNEVFD